MRWFLLLVLMLGAAGSYFQRNLLAAVAPALAREYGLSMVDLSWVYAGLTWGMIFGYLVLAAVAALAGSRWALLVAFAGSSLAALGSGLASGFAGLVLSRALLGFFAAGLIPAGVQAVREWFHPGERPLAIGMILAAGQFGMLVSWPAVGKSMDYMTPAAIMAASAVPTLVAAFAGVLTWQSAPPAETGWNFSPMALGWGAALIAALFFMAPVNYFVAMPLPGFFGEQAAALWIRAGGMVGAAAAGLAAWGMIQMGIPALKVHLGLLAASLVLLPLVGAARMMGGGVPQVVLMMLCMAGTQALSALLYSGVANTAPTRAVAVVMAAGLVAATVGSIWFPYVMARFR